MLNLIFTFILCCFNIKDFDKMFFFLLYHENMQMLLELFTDFVQSLA
jgi:predicted transcriptional regulator